MTLFSCSREAEVLTALREQHWPQASEPELRSHVAGCSHCSELVLISQSFQQARQGASQEAPLPSAGVLWWRAQVQRRNGAIARVNKPIVLAEKAAWAATWAVALALTLWQRHRLGDLFRSVGKVSELWASSADGWTFALLGAALGTVSLLGGVALYLAAKQD